MLPHPLRVRRCSRSSSQLPCSLLRWPPVASRTIWSSPTARPRPRTTTIPPSRLTRWVGSQMHHFDYKDGVLCAEEVRLDRLAEEIGTPFYCYSTATLERHYKVFAAALPTGSLVAYAAKANDNLAVLKTMGRLGAGCDVVSGGELAKALAAGILANKIVFSGVGKTREEMRSGLEAGIYQFNIESEPELLVLDDVARGLGKPAPIALRINPDVDAKTHAKINTGTAETKFGIPFVR